MLISAFSFEAVYAQTRVTKRGILKPIKHYAVVLYTGGGIANYTSAIINQGLQTSNNRTNPSAMLRIMWHPNYRLRVGIETGLTNFYSYTIKNGNETGKVTLSAVPILVVWSIPIIKRVNIFAGFGSYYLATHLNYLGKVKSGSFSLGSSIALNYVQPITKKIAISTEAKWMNAFQTKDNQMALQVNLAWKFLEY